MALRCASPLLTRARKSGRSAPSASDDRAGAEHCVPKRADRRARRTGRVTAAQPGVARGGVAGTHRHIARVPVAERGGQFTARIPDVAD